MNYDYIRACKQQSGLTNKAIATSKSLSESTVSRFFNGEIKSPDIELTKAIFDAIGASADCALGLVRPIDSAMTEPTPSIPAVVTDVVQSISDIVDEQKVAEHVAEAIKASPAVDPQEIARAVVAAMPPHDCDTCRTARLYEATILRQSKLIAVLFGASGGLMLFIFALLVWLIAK